MRWMMTCTLAGLLCVAVAAEETTPTILRFSKGDRGGVPGNWKAEQTGEGKGSEWEVVEDRTTPSKTGYALAQKAKGPSRLFNLCVAEKTKFKDGVVSVWFKPMAGKIDQGGGLVWRYKDAKNYYTCRYNPLEDNFRLYKVVDGKRMQLATKEEISLPAGKWYSMSITQKGNEITCTLSGNEYLKVKDDTFKDEGKVGLWTKADAQTSFDNLVIKGK